MTEYLNMIRLEQPIHSQYRTFGRGGQFRLLDDSELPKFSPAPNDVVVLVNRNDPKNWSMSEWSVFSPDTSGGVNIDTKQRTIFDPQKHIIYIKDKNS